MYNSFEVATEEARHLIYVMDAAGFLRDHADGGGAEQLYWRSGILPVGQEFRVTRPFSMYT